MVCAFFGHKDTPQAVYPIIKENIEKLIVQEAQIVVCYVTHTWGGAAQFAEYARRQGKQIINLANAE